MAMFKCKMCGGNLEVSEDVRVVECEYCGTNQTVPDGSDEKKTNLFNRANRLRMDCEFDKASGVYESIVSEYPEESEGYWGLCLCKFGIEYVDDAATGKKIPTCHRTNTTSIMDDSDFEQALENADVVAKSVYREEAKAIDRLQRQIISVVESEEPYDVFICYKETDDITKQRTEDSTIAQDIYTELVREGYKVFFSRITLRDKAGTEYEPYIYAALKSAKVMLAIGTKYEYYDAVWVKNEWSRYIAMMSDDSSKHLIPCYKNLDAYDIPKEFKNLQALDIGEMTFLKNLFDNVNRFIPKAKTETVSETIEETVVVQNQTVLQTEPLLKRVFMFLEDGNWASADEYCEKVLDIDPECARAYLGKLLSELNVTKQEHLKNLSIPFGNSNNYQKVIRFGDKELKETLTGYIEFINKRREQAFLCGIYNEAKEIMNQAKEEAEYLKAASLFHSINEYEDASALASKCREKASETASRAEAKRQKAVQRIEMVKDSIACSPNAQAEIHFGIRTDGTIATSGIDDPYYRHELSDWWNVRAISVGEKHVVALLYDGTVRATGDNEYRQCDVFGWNDIVDVKAGGWHTVGLKKNGRVVAVGSNLVRATDVSKWENIVKIAVGKAHTVGLKADGTVVSTTDTGMNRGRVSDWKNVVDIYAFNAKTVGLTKNGKVLIAGDGNIDRYYVENWTDIQSIAMAYKHMVGLKEDGTVVATGDYEEFAGDVLKWKDIVAVSTLNGHTVGLKSDGTVVACGRNDYGQCNVSDWRDIVYISAGAFCTVGVKSNGRVIRAGVEKNVYAHISKWKLFDNLDYLELERKGKIEKRMVMHKIKWEEKRKKLLAEKENLAKELSTLGFFAMGRKKEINTRLSEIEKELNRG